MADEPKPRTAHKTRKPPLSAQDIRFARLLFDRGAKTVAECYLEAGFPPHATPNATNVAAHRKLKNRTFREFYRRLQDRAADAAQLDANLVTQGLMRVAFADRGGLFDRHGRLLPPDQWPADVAACVEGVESEDLYEVVSERGKPKRKELRGFMRKVRTAPRTEALKTLAQIVRLTGREAEQAAAAGKAAEPLVVVAGPDVVPPPSDAPS